MKEINFEQNSCFHEKGPKIEICETTSESVFILNSAFTSTDNFISVAIDEARDAFKAFTLDFE